MKLVSLNRWVREKKLGRESTDGVFEVDLRKLASFREENAVVEGHLSHHLPKRILSAVVVLRLHPRRLERRLRRRGYSKKKILDNLEAEALDLILVEALQRHGEKVHQIDMTNRSVEEAVEIFLDALRSGKRVFENVDWLEEFVERYGSR